MSLSTQPYKGARDFYPYDKRLQNWMFDKMREVVEKFGYEEYDAPILEPLDMYLSKTSEEIVTQQTYSFTDRGDRKVTLRPEMTPTVSRMVAAQRQELAYPLRWYSIPVNWRYERPQHGRLREFWQLNVDIFGVDDVNAEIEMMLVTDNLMKAFGANDSMYEIRVNSRELLNQRIEEAGVKTSVKEVVRLVDTLEKMDEAKFKEALAEQVNDVDKLYNFLTSEEMSDEIARLIKECELVGVKIVPKPSLARGFDYYTDIVFEVFDKNPENNRSMFGGGRYDGLVELFGAEPVASVGFGMGDVTLQDFLTAHNLLPKLDTETDIYAVMIGDVVNQARQSIGKLRKLGLNVAVDLSGRKPDKQIKSAVKKGIKYALFIGEKELGEDKFTLKNLDTSEESNLSLEEIANKLQPHV